MTRYADQDMLAFVMFFSQARTPAGDAEMQTMTRELVDAALEAGGRYYLPYRLHPTTAQFHRAYPQADEFFNLKRHYDPQELFQNEFYRKYGTSVEQPIQKPQEVGGTAKQAAEKVAEVVAFAQKRLFPQAVNPCLPVLAPTQFGNDPRRGGAPSPHEPSSADSRLRTTRQIPRTTNKHTKSATEKRPIPPAPSPLPTPVRTLPAS